VVFVHKLSVGQNLMYGSTRAYGGYEIGKVSERDCKESLEFCEVLEANIDAAVF
jgi:hypothetical protein